MSSITVREARERLKKFKAEDINSPVMVWDHCDYDTPRKEGEYPIKAINVAQDKVLEITFSDQGDSVLTLMDLVTLFQKIDDSLLDSEFIGFFGGESRGFMISDIAPFDENAPIDSDNLLAFAASAH